MANCIDRLERQKRYVDILTDAGFKAVFGEERNSDVLMDLLNIILPRERQVKAIFCNGSV